MNVDKNLEKSLNKNAQMNVCRYYLFHILYWPIRVVMGIWHIHRFKGRQNVPQGPAVVCCNHVGLADPVWVALAMHDKKVPWIMAKKSVLAVPVIGRFLSWWGAFGVDRDNADVAAIKKSLRVLKGGEKLLIFPEGTRIRKGKKSEPKSGAVMIANRAGVPILPVYVSERRFPLQPCSCIIGEPFTPQLSGRHPSAQELEVETESLMDAIYKLGETNAD